MGDGAGVEVGEGVGGRVAVGVDVLAKKGIESRTPSRLLKVQAERMMIPMKSHQIRFTVYSSIDELCLWGNYLKYSIRHRTATRFLSRKMDC